MLCLEGLALALRIFNGQEKIPRYTVANISKESMLKMHVKKEVTLKVEKSILGIAILLDFTDSIIHFPWLADISNPALCCLCGFEGHNF